MAICLQIPMVPEKIAVGHKPCKMLYQIRVKAGTYSGRKEGNLQHFEIERESFG
jgi:hypothetical protein